MKKTHKNSEGKDLYEKFHRFPGDTSESRWITFLFSFIGVCMSIADFVLYPKLNHIPIVMVCVCLFNILFAYIELNHLFIRKYWFRFHRRLAVILSLLIYWSVAFGGVYLVVSSLLDLSWVASYIYIPFFLMPSLIVVIIILFAFIHVLGG